MEKSTGNSIGQTEGSGGATPYLYSTTSSHLEPSIRLLRTEEQEVSSESKTLKLKAGILARRCERRVSKQQECLFRLQMRDEKELGDYQEESETLQYQIRKLRETRKALQEVFLPQSLKEPDC